MHAQFEMTVGLVRLQQLIASFPPDSQYWNEAQNRFQFVDRLLVECLGWEKPNMRVEVTDESGGRSDYILGQPVKAILEAKKEAKHFESLPAGKSTTVRKLSPMLQASKILEAAVHQVLQYCVIHGAQIAIVCNGPQLVVFQALTPGYSPLEGECFSFNGFESYIEFFPLLWTLLSPEGITENRASRELSHYRNPRIPPKASEFILEPNRFRYRNNFQENLRELSALLLEEIEDNPKLKSSFYQECYVPLEANNRHLLLSKRIIAARYRRVGDDGITPSAMDTIAKTARSGDLAINDVVLHGIAGSRPIVVIGDVGVGKTSFFENLYEKLEQSVKAVTYFLHINLGIRSNLSSDVKSHVLSAVPNTLRQKYGVDINSFDFISEIYRDELRDFDRGVKGALRSIDPVAYQKERIAFLVGLTDQRDVHLHTSLDYLSKARGKHIILVMDNADQRNFSIQQEAFLIAQELAATRNLLVFIALRPSTFYLSKASGALSGYQHKILTISPPPADEVVQRRITFAVRVAEGKVAPASLDGIRLQLGSVVAFLRAMLRSIRTNVNIRMFLSNITGGNTRSVIELVSSFCGSPNIDSQKIVAIEESQGNYKIPLHEFTKHALLGEYAYFNSQSSPVACNIFDVSSADPREHFLASLIVQYLGSNIGVRDNDGFLSGENIVVEMAKCGFIETQVRHALRRLAGKRLIETPHAHYRELEVKENEPPEQFHYRATSVGIYHVKFWSGSFAFLDATSTDTPIFDEDDRNEVSRLSASFEISDRYCKTLRFKKYLEGQWHHANIGATYYDFPALLQMTEDSFASVKQFVEHKPTSKSKRYE